jgi:DNA adenine methylase
MGHYEGYTMEDFEMLLKKLSEIKGKFLLSSYPGELLQSYAKQFKWNMRDIEMNLSAAGFVKRKTRKTEVLTWNYNV